MFNALSFENRIKYLKKDKYEFMSQISDKGH
jgi:hypothetical protein